MASRRSSRKKTDVAAFLRGLEEDPLPRVLGIGGPERVLVEDALKTIRSRALSGGLADFNHDRLKARGTGAQQIVNFAKTLPTMAPTRLVEVDGAEDLGEDALGPLEAYLADAPAETVLVFVFGKLDMRQKVPRLLSQKAMCVRMDHPREYEMPRLVQQRARRHKLRMNDEVADAIAITVGTDLGFLERALEKLTLVVEDRDVTLDDVSDHVADTHLEDAFAFGAAIAAGDRAGALRRLSALQQNRAAPLQLLGLVAWQLRQMVRARDLLDEGMAPNEVTKECKAYGDRAQALLAGARRFDPRAHQRRLGRLAYVDRMLKSSKADDWRWLERMVFELCPARHPARSAARAT